MLSALVGRITTHDIVFPLDLLPDLRLSPESGGWMDPRTSDTFDFCRGAHAGTSPSRGIFHWQTEPQWNAGFGASATGSTAMPQIFPLPSTTNSWYPGHIGLGGTHLHRHSVTVSSPVRGCTIPVSCGCWCRSYGHCLTPALVVQDISRCWRGQLRTWCDEMAVTGTNKC